MVPQAVTGNFQDRTVFHLESATDLHMLFVVRACEVVLRPRTTGLGYVAVNRPDTFVRQVQANLLVRVLFERNGWLAHLPRVRQIHDRALVYGPDLLAGHEDLDFQPA